MSGRSGGDEVSAAVAVGELVAALDLAWKQVGREFNPQTLQELARATAALVEGSQRQGYPKVAELASIVEVMLAPIVDGDEPLTNEFKEIVRDYLKALERLSGEGPERAPTERPVPATPVTAGEMRGAPEVLLLQAEPGLASDLSHQIGHFGYLVRALEDLPGVVAYLEHARPHAVIVDINSRSSSLSIDAAVGAVRRAGGSKLPIILLAEADDVESRLLAARAGADVYLVKPFDQHELIDRLDRMGAHEVREPLHIVIVEDSTTQATYYSAVLKKAGMVATVVSDPTLIMRVLEENSADLVLMDMYMPHCNGMELAKVIRQVPRYASIPIVFLSAETEIERQLDAMSLGGDDFLTKPINPAHLIRSVAIRAERARTLRSLMLTDTLTGLLNHTRIKEQLHNEVARAARNKGQVAFAMLDIDHFKSVNDSYGHPVGDRVIKTLARVLQQGLRQTDYIGRYGGEEFAVILPDAGVEEALEILDRIRGSFGKIRQLTPSGSFEVTFSGGVACFPDTPDAVKLAFNADQALYAAKRAGRNRILPFNSSQA